MTTRRPALAAKRGRPRGARDRQPRRPRADQPSRRHEVEQLRAEHPDWSVIAIGEALGMTRQAIYYHLRTACDGGKK